MVCSSDGALVLSGGGGESPGRVRCESACACVSGPSRSAGLGQVERAISVPRDLWWSEW